MTTANYLLSDSSFNPPDTPDEDNSEHLNIADKVEYFLEHCPNLCEYLDEYESLVDAVNIIIHDADDDKEGRIRQLYRDKIKLYALYTEEFYDTTNQARHLYNAMLRSR